MSTTITLTDGNISSTNYVEITSSRGGATAVSTKSLGMLLMTTNDLFPTNSQTTFTGADDVLSYMNDDDTTDEYLIASYYFNYTSKLSRTPEQMIIGRWANEDTDAQIKGGSATLATLEEIDSGVLEITLNSVTTTISNIDHTSDTSLSDVASTLQTAIQSSDVATLTSATVEYNSDSGGFDFDTQNTADGDISVASTLSGYLSALGWTTAAAKFSSGISAQTVAGVMNNMITLSDDFGTFAFIPDLLTTAQITALASWNSSENYRFMYSVRVTDETYSDIYDAVNGYKGTALTLYLDNDGEYPEIHPCAEAGAIRPTKANAFPNFMFNSDSALTATVTTDDDKDTYDAKRVNYMGRTQKSGTTLTWYQDGYLMGDVDDDAVQMSVYMGEVWLKAAMEASLLSMFDAVTVTKNLAGKALAKGYLMENISTGLKNGVIMTGKTLTTSEKAYIEQVTGSDDAAASVANNGYWLDIDFDTDTDTSGVTINILTYTLVYSKSDKIRKVTGEHVMI